MSMSAILQFGIDSIEYQIDRRRKYDFDTMDNSLKTTNFRPLIPVHHFESAFYRLGMYDEINDTYIRADEKYFKLVSRIVGRHRGPLLHFTTSYGKLPSELQRDDSHEKEN